MNLWIKMTLKFSFIDEVLGIDNTMEDSVLVKLIKFPYFLLSYISYYNYQPKSPRPSWNTGIIWLFMVKCAMYIETGRKFCILTGI